jgi:ATP-dependent helicase/nuclease subunit B
MIDCGPAQDYTDRSLEGLLELIRLFDDSNTPYMPVPRPEHAPRFSDYAQLARRGEWSVDGGEGE